MNYCQTCILLMLAAAVVLGGCATVWAKRRLQPLSRAAVAQEEGANIRYAFVYVAGSEGLKRLREELGTREGWWKVGVVGARGGDPQALLACRMRMLKGYAGVVRTASGLVEESGFEAWHVQPLARPASIRLRSEISMLPNCIRVRLPDGISFSRFDAQLRNALSDRSLLHHLGTSSSACGARYTRINGRYVLQTEIVRMRPRLSIDITHLLALIAEIIDRGRPEVEIGVEGAGTEITSKRLGRDERSTKAARARSRRRGDRPGVIPSSA